MTLAELSLKRPVTAVMFFVSMTVIGLLAAFRLPLEYMPDIQVPFLFIDVPYPGSTPAEIERTIARPIEEAMSTLDRHPVNEFELARRWRAAVPRIQVGPGRLDQGGRGARQDRCDPRGPAGRLAALLRFQVLDIGSAGPAAAHFQRRRPVEFLRAARSQAQATARTPARRGQGHDPGRGTAGSANRAVVGSADRAQHQPQRSGQIRCARPTSRLRRG